MDLMTRRKLIGKASKVNIYSPWGVLLIPSHTKITQEHIDKLQRHDITLNPSDIIPFKPHKYEEMIDKAVPKVREVFDEVRHTLKLPLSELQKDVVPIITAVSDGTQLTHLFSSLREKDDYTYRHNLAVGAISKLIGQWLKLSKDEVIQLAISGLLHDIGKMRIPEKILNKPSRLTDEEFEIMKKHTIYGYEIIKETKGTLHVHARVALEHHERMDGSGYPNGLKKDEIHLFSRIVSVADVFHAMTSKRIYRNPSPFYEVLYQMNEDSFGILDAKITRVFIEKTMNSLIGTGVELTDGREGTIIMIHQNDPIHPLIQVRNTYIDLRKESSVHIAKIHH